MATEAPVARQSFALTRPLDLRLTLGPIGEGSWLRVEDARVQRATLTPHGPATLLIERHQDWIEVAGWGPGATWAVDRAPALCGQEDDDSGFVPSLAMLKDLRRRHAGLRITRTGAVFEALVPAILGQKVTGIEARRAYNSLVNELGSPAPAQPEMRVPPGPEVLSRTPYWTFHRFGVERRRAETIIRAARSAKRLEETLTMQRDAAQARLQALPGVGPWTAAMVALTALGDADAVPVGDYNLPHAVGYALEGTPRSTDERMLELLEPYRGHRGRVIRLLMAAHLGAPRFGPRMPLRDIARS